MGFSKQVRDLIDAQKPPSTTVPGEIIKAFVAKHRLVLADGFITAYGAEPPWYKKILGEMRGVYIVELPITINWYLDSSVEPPCWEPGFRAASITGTFKVDTPWAAFDIMETLRVEYQIEPQPVVFPADDPLIQLPLTGWEDFERWEGGSSLIPVTMFLSEAEERFGAFVKQTRDILLRARKGVNNAQK